MATKLNKLLLFFAMMSIIIECIESQTTSVVINFNGNNGTGGPGTLNGRNETVIQGNITTTQGTAGT